MNAIETAMFPLRTEAVRRARGAAQALVKDAYLKLGQAQYDFDATAPRGTSSDARSEFIEKAAYRGILACVTRRSRVNLGVSISPRFEPSAPGESAFLAAIERAAANEFDEYVEKCCESSIMRDGHRLWLNVRARGPLCIGALSRSWTLHRFDRSATSHRKRIRTDPHSDHVPIRCYKFR